LIEESQRPLWDAGATPNGYLQRMEKLLGLDRIPEVCMLCEKVELLG